MSITNKILLQPEFEYYHFLLMSHCMEQLFNHKQSLMSIAYDEENRVLEFGALSSVSESITFTDDGNGNVTMSLLSSSILTDDNEGNATLTGATFTDNGIGNVYIS